MNRLVRDKTLETMLGQGKTVEVRIAPAREYEGMLWRKLREGLDEFILNTNDEKLADILEVLHCIADSKGMKWHEVEDLRLKKNEARGSYARKIIIEKVE